MMNNSDGTLTVPLVRKSVPTPQEVLHRERKVLKLTDYLIEKLIRLLEEDPALWESAALGAGVSMPSDTSKAMILGMLRGRAKL